MYMVGLVNCTHLKLSFDDLSHLALCFFLEELKYKNEELNAESVTKSSDLYLHNDAIH